MEERERREKSPVLEDTQAEEEAEEEREGVEGALEPSTLFKWLWDALKNFERGFQEMVCVTVDLSFDGILLHGWIELEEETREEEQEQNRNDDDCVEGAEAKEKVREVVNGES